LRAAPNAGTAAPKSPPIRRSNVNG
jgi:hypothetical protein